MRVNTVKLGVIFVHRGVMDRNFSLDKRGRILKAFAGNEDKRNYKYYVCSQRVSYGKGYS